MLIDVHCHANLYLAIDEIVKEAQKMGVDKIISVAMSITSLERVLELANVYNSIYPALGIHPGEVKNNPSIEVQLDSVIELIRKNREKLCAIGEIGLDYYFVKEKELYPLQRKIFENMLSLAQELELPINLHIKAAENLVFNLLPSYNIKNVNIHWYKGPEKYLKIGIDRGYFFSFNLDVKYSAAVRKNLLIIDEEHILLESDGPVEYYGIIGTPANLREVLNSISLIKKEPSEKLETQIMLNTRKIFPKIFILDKNNERIESN